LLTYCFFSDHYGGSYAVALTFQTSDRHYIFPREVLVEGFDYFKEVLGEAIDSERQTRSLNLDEISSETFALLLRYVQARDASALRALVFQDVGNVDQLIEVLIAADYLEITVFQEITELVCNRLAVEILLDRRKLTSSHVDLVALHITPETSWANCLWNVLAWAGVRPFLQDYFSNWKETSSAVRGSWPCPGHRDAEQWGLIVLHCRQLRQENDKHALDVAERVTQVLKSKRSGSASSAANGMHGSLSYLDPLSTPSLIGPYIRLLDTEVSFHFTI
jgi:hypothetical protein